MGESESYTVADAFLESLALAGIDYIFAVLGSDHPSIIEAYVRRQSSPDQQWPKLLLFLHEFVAMSAADGYARLTGKPQCVLVHVDVGTNALGQGLHNASSGKAPVLIFAGQAPYTLYGELPGSRSEHVQWYQDVPNQHMMVAPFSRYSNEIKAGEHVQMMVNRALLMSTTGSPGPVYLTATREVLASRTERPRKVKMPSCAIGGLPDHAIAMIGDAIIQAKRPLVVTGYLGRNHEAVNALIQLADVVDSLGVFDFEQREMSFPSTHEAWLSRAAGAGQAIKTADVILVIDADVPWIPTKVKPSPEATIFHVDLDPRKEMMNLFDIYADATFHGDSNTILRQLHTYTLKHQPSSVTDGVSDRRQTYESGLKALSQRAAPASDGFLTKDFLFRTIRETVPEDSVFVHDAITNQIALTEQLQLSRPGSNFSKGGSGLGWACGAAIGISLALKWYDLGSPPSSNRRESEGPSKFVVNIIGDGAFMFSSPSAVFWAAYRHKTPFLTIVLNNGGWKATRSCVNDVHPGGLAAGMSDEQLAIDLKMEGPDYCGIAKAGSNGHLRTWKINRWEDLKAALQEAVVAVQNGTGAIIDAVVKD
ncbi:acetolactate synthase [Rhizodiscina lignyota]|uniref:Acetolactate synthase n=1 Tax=Rhizodiscina lignyota TaxID=1504668 RepID=A0A9P4M9J5_9PEZI|nr:acetolactate synthase [Rhizodiscina lignyota]